jgi:glycosyltransferase involved in cell wall biosynthesis
MATVLDELLKNNTRVSMATLCRSDYQTLFANYFKEVDSRNTRDYWILPFHLPVLGVYQRLLTPIPTLVAAKSSKPDVVFLDHEMFRSLRDISKDCKIVWYCHFPYVVWAMEKFGEETIPEKYGSFPWSLYWKGFLALQRLVVVEENFADLTLVNSSYTARYVKKIWDTDPIIVHPPVDLESFDPRREKKNLIVSVGRFSGEKRFEDALGALALCETSAPLVFIGTLSPSGRPYFNNLKQLAEKLRVADRTYFIVNASFTQLRTILAEAKIYVHCMKHEHFGISVAEAMASGCIPIVPMSGGCWEDIVLEGRHGLGWNSISELAEKLDDLLTNDEKSLYWKRMAIERSKVFDEKSFREKIRRFLLEI